ncbi:alcohol dehydrogenase catalytic domain-containing protein [Streptacidiphilus monticola]
MPQPGPGEVLIRVTAAAVNPADIGMRDGRYRWREPVRFLSSPATTWPAPWRSTPRAGRPAPP